MFGLSNSAVKEIKDELREKGYDGLIDIFVINPEHGVNQIQGRPVIAV